MLAIKLKPIGKKNHISFRIAVMEKKSKLKGKFTEDLGWYNPHTNKFSVNGERARYWISAGAQPTPSIHNIFVNAKIVDGPKIPLHKKSKKPIEAKQEGKQEAIAEKTEAPIEKAETPVAPVVEEKASEDNAPVEENKG